MSGYLEVKGVDEKLVDVSENTNVSQHSVLPIDWIAALHDTNLSQALTVSRPYDKFILRTYPLIGPGTAGKV